MTDKEIEQFEEENKEMLKKLADHLAGEEAKEMEEYRRLADEMDLEIDDSAILEKIRTYDAERAADAKTTKPTRAGWSFRRIGRLAAVFVLCVITVGALGLASSDAFRIRFFNLFYDNEAGGVSIRAEDQELLKDWSGYWYPTVLPEGYQLVYAEESLNGHSKDMVFSSPESEDCIFTSQFPLSSSYSHDTDHHNLEQVMVNGHDAYYITSDIGDYTEVIILFDDSIVSLGAEWDAQKDEMLEMAKGLQYKK